MYIEVSIHAYNRGKERLGLKKKSMDRMAQIAYEKGINHGDTKGQLFAYISDRGRKYMFEGQAIRIYGDVVYCFVRHPEMGKIILCTIFTIPKGLSNQIHALSKRKKKRAEYQV